MLAENVTTIAVGKLAIWSSRPRDVHRGEDVLSRSCRSRWVSEPHPWQGSWKPAETSEVTEWELHRERAARGRRKTQKATVW